MGIEDSLSELTRRVDLLYRLAVLSATPQQIAFLGDTELINEYLDRAQPGSHLIYGGPEVSTGTNTREGKGWVTDPVTAALRVAVAELNAAGLDLKIKGDK